MALPAGRYGVTKNQLLKIKKLPMNTIKLIEELTEKFDLLGTAAFKNSTSVVVTESSDLVESGAVKDMVGWGNKNLTDWKWNTFTTGNKLLITLNKGTYTISAQSTLPNGTTFIRGTKQDSSYCSKTELGVDNWTDSSTAGVYATTELLSSYTFSVPEDNVLIEFGRTNCNGTIPAQLEKGSTATAYEPYHASVSDSLAEKADNSVIGTVEDGTTASKAWSVGEHFISGGQFKEVTQAIASGGAISDSNTVNKPIADCLPTRVEDITSEFTFSTDCSWVANWTKVKKNGHMITVVLRFTTPSTVSADKSIITFPAKYKPIQLNDYNFSMAGLLGKAFSGERAGLATFYVSGNEYGIRLASNEWLANTAVVAQFTYMI